ncbi:MAG: glycosyltransferase family 2 protein, partial [Thermomicrobiaceae bacterium]|nr:glycosyltransferase family 2 protein [Thermomicrobiaceae bacterium]
MSRGGSICVVLPAYEEAENLPPVVEATRRYLAALGADYRIVVVDDGSRDGTAEVAARLAMADPDRLQVVRHPVNRGYGAAVRSGLAAALATPCEWVLLTDSDGQFDIADLGTLLDVAAWERADLVAGHRVRRADPAIRRLNAWLWGSACRLLLGFEVRDVDCAFKLIHRRVLESVSLEGEAAVISPELLAKA